MRLQVFDGGLDTRLAPELIKANEAVICENVDISSGQLAPCQDVGTTAITTVPKPYYYHYSKEWMQDADVRNYLEYQDKLYWTSGSLAKKYFAGIEQDLGIAKPGTAPITVLNAATGITATVQYMYTYYNSVDGTESEPSAISAELVLSNQSADVSVTASPDAQVTHIWLYRIGGTFLVFNKVTELSNITQTYTDSDPETALAIISNTSTYNGKAPADLKYLSQAYGMFFGAVGSKFYYSRDVGNPNYWPETNYINFPDTITGVWATHMGMLVFTYYQTFIITGTTANAFVKQPLDSTQGCINYNSIANYANSLLFLSNDGICTVSGGKVLVMSKIKLGKQTYSSVNAVVHDEVYYLQLADNSILTYDLRYKSAFKTYALGTSWLAIADDVLYAYKTDGMYSMFTGTAASMHYKTGNLTESSLSTLKLYDEIRLYLSGTITLTIYINEVSVISKSLVGEKKPITIKVPQKYQMGSSIQFEITGTGTIKEMKYGTARDRRTYTGRHAWIES